MDFEKKVATSEPLVKSLSAENETLKNKVVILTAEAENDKERVVTLEKSLHVEKDFCKLKDKQIGDLELRLENIGATTIQDFKDSDKYSVELCKYSDKYSFSFPFHLSCISTLLGSVATPCYFICLSLKKMRNTFKQNEEHSQIIKKKKKNKKRPKKF